MFEKNLVWGKLDWKVRRLPPWLDRNPIDPPMIIVIVTSSSSPSSRSLIITLINIITPSIIINVKYHKIFTGMTVSHVQNKTTLMYFNFSLTSLSLYCYIGQMFLCLVDSYPHKEISNICFVWYFSNHFFPPGCLSIGGGWGWHFSLSSSYTWNSPKSQIALWNSPGSESLF